MKRIYDFEVLSQDLLSCIKEKTKWSDIVSVSHIVNEKTGVDYIIASVKGRTIYITRGVIGLLVFGIDGGDPWYAGDAEDVEDILWLLGCLGGDDDENVSLLI